MKYNAFISYSHAADGRMAPALQSALERFAKPWYKLRNLNVFRDEASLSASPHLWSNIQKALDDSEYLIYMASPESAASKWVSKEIEYWLEIRSLDTILIVLSDGHLHWDDRNGTMGNPKDNSLPTVLDHEFNEQPFYVDLREMRSETDLSLNNPLFKKDVLKLAAQLHGKAPKDLASEEVSTHRKMIWTRNSAALLLVLLLIFSFLSTKSALNSLEVISAKDQENYQKDLDLKSKERANILTEKKLEKQKLETKNKQDSLRSAQEQEALSEKLAETRKLLAEKMIDNTKTTVGITLEMNREAKAEIIAMQKDQDELYQLLKSKHENQSNLIVESRMVYFDYDRFFLRPGGAQELNHVIEVLNENYQFDLQIVVPYYFSFIEEKTMEWLNEIPKISRMEDFDAISTVNTVITKSLLTKFDGLEMRGVRNQVYQEKLQIKRGQSVKAFLVDRGIDPARITINYKMLFADDVLVEYKKLKTFLEKEDLLQKNDYIKIDYY